MIHWPRTPQSGRFRPADIPAGTNRIVITVSGQNIPSGTIAYVVDKPPFDSSTPVNVEIPAGPGRLFYVQARQVAQTKYANPTRVDLTDGALSEGTLLGSGSDLTPHDIGPGQTVSASVTINGAGTPDAGTTDVKLTINQVLAGSFPTVLALQIIRDQNGNPISNLNAGNFDVIEDGTLAVITDVRTVQQSAPSTLSVALVLDRSGSMDGQKNTDLEAAATQFVGLQQANDYGEVINFSDTVDVTQPFTTDKNALLGAIQGRTAAGNTALYDALLQGVNDTASQGAQTGGRLAVVALTDGLENSSSASESDVIQGAKQKGVPVFTIGLGSDVDPNVLGDIAAQTGGTYTFAPSSNDLSRIYTAIASQLNGQIQISFISPDITKSGRQRHVVVRFHYGSFSGESAYDYTM